VKSSLSVRNCSQHLIFERFKSENPDTLTDIQKAVRFYYLLKNGFASRIDNFSFSINTTRRPIFNLLRAEEELSMAHLRLSRVYIENMHFEKLIERFDRPRTFFYLDPPYYKREGYYGKDIFYREDFAKLRDILSSIAGKFIMSINDTQETRKIYKDFNIEEVSTTYNFSKASQKVRATELLIINFTPKKALIGGI